MTAKSFSLIQLQYFCSVADTGSFVSAAAVENVSPNAIAAAISSLERCLGTALCVRVRAKGVSLTPRGEILLTEARALLDAARGVVESVTNAHDDPSRPTRIGVLPALGDVACELAVRLQRAHPQTPLEFSARPRAEIRAALATGELDLAIADDTLRGDDLRSRGLYRTTVVALVGTHHRLASAAALTWDDLSGEPCVYLEQPGTEGTVFDLLTTHGLADGIRWRTPDRDVALDLTARGLGYCLVEQAPDERVVPDPRLHGLPIEPVQAGRQVDVVWSRRLSLGRSARRVIALAVAELGERPGDDLPCRPAALASMAS